jgi:hypothetical protein
MKFTVNGSTDGDVVRCEGTISEAMATEVSQLSTLVKATKITFDCQRITQINSLGISLWSRYLSGLARTKQIAFRDCSVTYVDYVLTIPTLQKIGPIDSFYAPMSCPGCERECEVRYDTAELIDGVPPRPCPRCKTTLENLLELDSVKGLLLQTLDLKK